MEWYRSGHNEADSKSVSQFLVARGFESHSLRDKKGRTWITKKENKQLNFVLQYQF